MRKLLIIALTFASINIAAGQVWAQYDFQVESAEAQAKIIAASNELMSSDFAKENLKGSVHLDVYICLLYTSPSPRDATLSRMPSSA